MEDGGLMIAILDDPASILQIKCALTE